MAEQESKQVGVGIIGAGKMGRIHASNLAKGIPNAKLVAVADLVEESARKLAGRVRGVRTSSRTISGSWRTGRCRRSSSATPTLQKPQIVKFASEVGKHIFCEKPIATTFHDAEQVMKSAQKSPAKFQVGYQRRFDPLHVKVKETIDSGEVGSIVLVKSNTRDPLPNPAQWPDLKSSGGIFFDTCSHDYDVVRWLCGSEVSRVEAEGSPRSQPDQHTVITNLSLANGVVAQVDASRMASYGYDVRVEVVGTRGRDIHEAGRGEGPARVEGIAGGRRRHTAGTRTGSRTHIGSRWSRSSTASSRTLTPRTTAQDGKAAVEIAAAARKSMQEGKAVNLPL